jgi:hypothetical protein
VDDLGEDQEMGLLQVDVVALFRDSRGRTVGRNLQLHRLDFDNFACNNRSTLCIRETGPRVGRSTAHRVNASQYGFRCSEGDG